MSAIHATLRQLEAESIHILRETAAGFEKPEPRLVRFRTLGCWPLSGTLESRASSVPDIVAEIRHARYSERQGSLIDSDQAGSMALKKQERYF